MNHNRCDRQRTTLILIEIINICVWLSHTHCDTSQWAHTLSAVSFLETIRMCRGPIEVASGFLELQRLSCGSGKGEIYLQFRTTIVELGRSQFRPLVKDPFTAGSIQWNGVCVQVMQLIMLFGIILCACSLRSKDWKFKSHNWALKMTSTKTFHSKKCISLKRPFRL